MKNGKIIQEIKKIFEDGNNFDGKPYTIQYKVVKVREFGIPQDRQRTIIVGSQINFDLEKEMGRTKEYIKRRDPYFFEHVSVWDAISNLPEPTSDGVVKTQHPGSHYQNTLQSDTRKTSNHYKTNHSRTSLQRMSKIKIGENYSVLDEKINSIHSGSYGRLDPNGIAPTITTRFDTPSGGKFIHPYKDRTLTPREAARIQSFPDSFKFYGSKSSVCKQIGNAVPPKLAFFLSVMIERILENDS